jgi:hypothetical protein
MFSPRERDLERGWPGRIDGEHVVQLAAQTLEAFLTGGGHAREHALYPLDDVVLRAPVLRPPSVRIFDGDDFRFGNPAAIHGPEDVVLLPEGAAEIVPVRRLAAIVGADGEVGAVTLMLEWVAPVLPGEKRRDFALTLGPVAVTPADSSEGDWERLLAVAVRNTRLRAGDIVAAPGRELEPTAAGSVELELAGIRSEVEIRS